MLKKLIPALALLVLGSGTALAHVSLHAKEAPIGSTYKAVFGVPHGCEGKPTNVVRIKIPEGFIAVKPQPKPGWTLEKVRGAYEKSYDHYGTPTSEGVTEVVWSGGNLGDDEYEEFVLRGYLTAGLPVGETLYFPVVQECAEGTAERWIEIPAKGTGASGSRRQIAGKRQRPLRRKEGSPPARPPAPALSQADRCGMSKTGQWLHRLYC